MEDEGGQWQQDDKIGKTCCFEIRASPPGLARRPGQLNGNMLLAEEENGPMYKCHVWSIWSMRVCTLKALTSLVQPGLGKEPGVDIIQLENP